MIIYRARKPLSHRELWPLAKVPKAINSIALNCNEINPLGDFGLGPQMYLVQYKSAIVTDIPKPGVM